MGGHRGPLLRVMVNAMANRRGNPPWLPHWRVPAWGICEWADIGVRPYGRWFMANRRGNPLWLPRAGRLCGWRSWLGGHRGLPRRVMVHSKP